MNQWHLLQFDPLSGITDARQHQNMDVIMMLNVRTATGRS